MLLCALRASASATPDRPMESYGSAWEAANGVSGVCRKGRVHADSRSISVMTGAALAAATVSLDGDCLDPPCWTPSMSGTPHEEYESDLRMRWLSSALERLPEVDADMLSLHIGLDDAPRTQVEIADAYGLSHTRVGQIVGNAVLRLGRAWRRELEQADLVLSGIVVKPVDFEPVSARQSVKDVQAALGVKPRSAKAATMHPKPKRVPVSFLAPPPRKERRSRVKLWGGGMSVYGHMVERTGEGVYRMQDGAHVDAAGAAAALCDLLGRDSVEARECPRLMRKYDTDIADAFGDLVDGPSWPTLGKDRRVLLLMTHRY